MVKKLFMGNKAYKEEVLQQDAFYHKLSKGQNPRVLWIGCSDSRVVPEKLVNAKPGELFVLRNVANIVSNDYAVGSAIEYAISHFSPLDIVVCGHYGCGGMKALLELKKIRSKPVKKWVSNSKWILGKVEGLLKKRKIDLSLSEETMWKAIVEANVLLQVHNLKKFYLKKIPKHISVYGWVSDIGTGKIRAHFPTLKKLGITDSMVAELKLKPLGRGEFGW